MTLKRIASDVVSHITRYAINFHSNENEFKTDRLSCIPINSSRCFSSFIPVRIVICQKNDILHDIMFATRIL